MAERDVLAVIAAGGALGSALRWGLAQAWPPVAGGIPWVTLLENVSGAVALGALMVFVTEVWPPRRYLRPFWGVGVLGGYTTYSTYALQIHELLLGGHLVRASAYAVATLLTGIPAAWLGILMARAAVRRAPRTSSPTDPGPEPDPGCGPQDHSMRRPR